MGNPLLFIPFRPPRFSACSLHDHDSHPSSRPAKPIVVPLPIFYSVIFASTPFIASCNLAVVPSCANVLQVCKIVLTNRSMAINLESLLTWSVFNKEHVVQKLKGCMQKKVVCKKMRKAYLHITFNTKIFRSLNLFQKFMLFFYCSDYIHFWYFSRIAFSLFEVLHFSSNLRLMNSL